MCADGRTFDVQHSANLPEAPRRGRRGVTSAERDGMSVTRTCPRCGYRRSYASDAQAEANHRRHSCARHLRRAHALQRQADRAAGNGKRECRHRGQPHPHGQRVTYVKDRCRCPECTAANASSWRAAARAQTLGRPSPYVDVVPVREHIAILRRAGIGYDQIARLAHTSTTHIREINGAVQRSGGRPPIRRIRSRLAQRILDIAPVPANRAANNRIDATGARRRLQALVALGYPVPDLARQLRRSPATVRRLLTARTITAHMARCIDTLYEQLSNAPPPLDSAAHRAARQLAANHGWRPPLAWDDIDHDGRPTATPNRRDPHDLDEIAVERAVAGDGMRLQDLTPAEQTEAVRRLTERGQSIRDIADQLATSTGTVSRRRRTATSAA